jgi:hypothetical protein
MAGGILTTYGAEVSTAAETYQGGVGEPMSLQMLQTIVLVLLALSVATERLVDITKGALGFLNKWDPVTNPDGLKKERYRRAAVQLLAVGWGVVITWGVSPAIPKEVLNLLSPLGNTWTIVTLGVLASGGSSFWNGVLSNLEKVKGAVVNAKASVAAAGGPKESDVALATVTPGSGIRTPAGAGGEA